ncbi:hypothetical protein TYRP_001896 [Tyrophagus putrescentiae]|nr:hypothetical protein TYRP_001896 [Tyrophagus putrescentiae]
MTDEAILADDLYLLTLGEVAHLFKVARHQLGTVRQLGIAATSLSQVQQVEIKNVYDSALQRPGPIAVDIM